MNKHERFIARRGRMRKSDPPASMRRNAEFTDENDHNPWVFRQCDSCGGQGTICEPSDAETYAMRGCDDCGETGVALTVERYFENDAEPIEVIEHAPDWVRCPSCGITFTLTDGHEWTGRRHRGCGQKLRITRKP